MRPRIAPLGDAALLIAFEPAIDPALNARVLALAGHLSAAKMPGVRDVVPAYASCAVHFDPLRTDRAALTAAIDTAIDRSAAAMPPAGASTLRIPVCYGGALGPDLPAVAAYAGCSEREVVRLHVDREYRVYMVGFLPGFPYMGRVDDRIAVPRLATPRARVPAGSVAVAGPQTGIYPVDAPGGWHIIGRTPVRLFDPSSSVPARIAPGAAVSFFPIDEPEYQLAAAADRVD